MSAIASSANVPLNRPHNLSPPPSTSNLTSPVLLEERGTFGQRLHVYEDDSTPAASEIFVRSEKDDDRIETVPPSPMKDPMVRRPAAAYRDAIAVRGVEDGNWRGSLRNRSSAFYNSTSVDAEGESSELEEEKIWREDEEELGTELRNSRGGDQPRESWRGEVGKSRTAEPRFRLLEAPTRLECPKCKERVVTVTKYKRGRAVWGTAFGLLLLTAGLLIWVPFCMGEYFKDVIHMCPNCEAKIGRYRRFSV